MTKLKLLLMESKEWIAWWMEPRGETHEVYTNGSNEGHFAWAKNHVHHNMGGWSMSSEDPTSTLMKLGWIRLAFNYYGDRVLHFDYQKHPPTEVQMRNIKKLAYKVGAERLKNDINDNEMSLDETVQEDLRSEDDGYFYHVTLAPAVPKIKAQGLKVRAPMRTVSNYASYSKGKIFLTDIGALDWWVSTIAAHAFHGFDDEKYHDIAIFRVKKGALQNIQPDKMGSDDSRGEAFYVTQDIPPEALEFVKIVESPY